MGDQGFVATGLPKGGGTVKGLGDTFTPDLYTGTGRFIVPLRFPKGARGFQPSLNLSYNTASGNGAFGMGWSLPTLTLWRRSDRSLPTYDDEQDTFLLNGAEIAPVCGTGAPRFRRLEEASFERILRVGDGWQVTDRAGNALTLGESERARVVSPDGNRTYAWHLERVCDPMGNEIRYGWQRDGSQLYLQSIGYGPYETVFLYESRTDCVEDRRPGFLISTSKRCQAIEFAIAGQPDPIFRRYRLTYEEAPYTGLSLLKQVVLEGVQGDRIARVPPLTFTYEHWTPTAEYTPMRSACGMPPPHSLDNHTLALVDMESEGLPGVLLADRTTRRYWPNRGRAEWGPPRTLRNLPARLDLSQSTVALADIDGDGTADLVDLSEGTLAYIRGIPGKGWSDRPQRFRRAPSFDLSNADTRLVDVDGNGRTDVVRSSKAGFYVYLNRGVDGWADPFLVPRIHDMDRFPDVALDDSRVRFADMTGDGLLDLVLVHGSRIDYWPHLGRLRFDKRRFLSLSPGFLRGFDPKRLLCIDVDGDGISDIVYVDRECVHIWINRSGNGLAYAGRIRYTPYADGNNVSAVDMLGRGSGGLLWTFSVRGPRDSNYKFLSFSGRPHAYLMTTIDNGMGLTKRIAYASSVEQALEARAHGDPWRQKLPIPLQTVAQITEHDILSGMKSSTRFLFRDGHFDGNAREFFGFGEVRVYEDGDATIPASLTITRFHQGESGLAPGASKAQLRAVRGKVREVEVFLAADDDSPGILLRRERIEHSLLNIESALDGRDIVFVHPSRISTEIFEGRIAPQRSAVAFEYDTCGNIGAKTEEWDGEHGTETRTSTYSYTCEATNWILNLPVKHEQRDGAGNLLKYERYFYDGQPFVGLPGGVTHGLLRRRETMILPFDSVGHVYGSNPPDFAALGYHELVTPQGERGWAIQQERFDHDPFGNPIRRRDALGFTQESTFDVNGIFQTSITDAVHHRTATVYDMRSGRVKRVTDPNGATTQFAFDALGRFLEMALPGERSSEPVLSFEHLDGSLPLGTRTTTHAGPDPEDWIHKVEYVDGRGNTLQLRSSADGGKVIVEGARRYNARGLECEKRSAFISDGFAFKEGEIGGDVRLFRFAYDACGRVVETTTPDGRLSRKVYGPGILTQFDVADLDGSPENTARGFHNTPTTNAFDARGRLRSVTERLSTSRIAITKYDWDAQGRLTAVVDAPGRTQGTYRYDMLDRTVRVDHPDAGTRCLVFDAAGNMVMILKGATHAIEMRYDGNGRKTEVLADGTLIEQYSYDAGTGSNLVGRLAGAEDQAGGTSWSYTSRGLVKKKTRHLNTRNGRATIAFGFSFDALGRVVSQERPDGRTLQFKYSKRGFLENIPGVIKSIEHNELGQIERIAFANGTTGAWAHDPATLYNTKASVIAADGTVLSGQAYNYDPVGNILSMRDLSNIPAPQKWSAKYTHDALYRLTGVHGPGPAETWTCDYDAAGNFTRNEILSGDRLYLHNPEGNQIGGALVNGAATPMYSFDDLGRMTRAPGRPRMEHDALGRLTEVETDDGTVVRYWYSHEGERIRRMATLPDGTQRESLYVDGYMERHDGSDYYIHRYNDQLCAVEPAGGGLLFLHTDNQGSVTLVTNERGGVIERRGYLPFGSVVRQSGARSTDFGFIGREHDPLTGLNYTKARFYDPLLGRFVSVDPYCLLNPAECAPFPGSLNPYVYALNRPLSLSDPDGLWWQWILGALIIIAPYAATVMGMGGLLTWFTGGLAVTAGGTLGAATGFLNAGFKAGWDLDAEWWAGKGGDAFLAGTIIGAATMVTAGVAGGLLGGGVAGSLGAEIAAGLSHSGVAVGSSEFAVALSGGITGGIIGAGNGAIASYARGNDFEYILLDILIGGAIGIAAGSITGFTTGLVPVTSAPTIAISEVTNVARSVLVDVVKNPLVNEFTAYLSESYS